MFEAWSVAIRLKLIDGVSSGLIVLSRQFARGNIEAKEFQNRLESIKKTMAVGAGLGLVGGGMFRLLDKTLPAAKELANQLSLMNTLGMKQAQIASVVGQAWATSYKVPTTTAAENLKTFRELRSVFGVGREGEAASMLPVVGRIQGVLTALTGKEQERVGFDLVKAIELRTGVMTQAALQRNAELMSRTIIGMGGTVNVSDFHGALKMGKIATNKWSDDFTYNYLPTLMQELKTGNGGAQTAGTALMSLYQQMHGRMTKAAMPLWVQAGLVKPSDIVKNATGQYEMKPGSVAGTGEFEQNPFAWVQQYLRPGVSRLMAARHITAETALNSMFSNRNAAFAAYNMYFKAAQYERDKQTIGQADSYTAYQKLLKTNPELAQMALQKQWQNLQAQIGYSILPDLIRGMQALLPLLQDFSKWANRNPEGLRMAVRGFAGIAALFTGGALLAGLNAAYKGGKLMVDVIGGLTRAGRSLGPAARAVEGLAAAESRLPAAANGLNLVTKALGGLSLLNFAGLAGGLGLLGAAGVADFRFMTDAKAAAEKRYGRKMSWGELFSGPGPGNGVHPSIAGAQLTPGKHGGGANRPVVVVKADRNGFSAWVAGGLAKLGSFAQSGSSTHDPTMSMSIPGLAYHGGN